MFRAALLAAAVALACPAQAQGPDVKVTLTGPGTARAGRAFTLTVAVAIPDGFHIQANTVKPPNIATKVLVKAPGGFAIGKPVYPKAIRATAGGQTLDVFEGKAIIRIPVTARAGARGAAAFRATVTFQACDESSCYPPTETTARCIVRVAGAR